MDAELVQVRDQLRGLVAKLDVLGTTEAVGLELIAKGIKAVRGCPITCVLVGYLQQEAQWPEKLVILVDARLDIDNVDCASPSRWSVEAFLDSNALDPDAVVRVALPEHVGRLAAQFDAGCWPELDVDHEA